MSYYDATIDGSELPTFTVEVIRTTTRRDKYTIDVSARNQDDAVQAAKAVVFAPDEDPRMDYAEYVNDLNIVNDDCQFQANEMNSDSGS